MRTLLIATFVGLSLTAGTASAQFGQFQVPNYGPGYRGNISPYLNILRGSNTGIDYFLGTRSEFQRRFDSRQFRDDLSNFEDRFRQPLDDIPGESPPITSGASSVMNNTGSYFNNTFGYFSTPGQPGRQPRPGAYSAPSRRGGRGR